MTKTYIVEKTVVRELPEMERPTTEDFTSRGPYDQLDFDGVSYWDCLAAYNEILSRQPTFTRGDNGFWKEGQIVPASEMEIKERWNPIKQSERGTIYQPVFVATPKQKEGGVRIYIASKTRHADKWISLKESGVNIISTWIFEAGEGQTVNMPDLCRRCISEALECDAMIVYSEEGDYLKGAFIEMGVALSVPLKPIYLVGPVLPYGSAFTYSHQVFGAKSVEEAISILNQKSKP